MQDKPNEKIIETARVDRRILRTRKALRAALLELSKEKGFDAISVEEITERANLGRATFYLHYKDKEDLLLDEFREIASNRVQVLSEIPILIWKSNQGQIELVNNSVPLMPLQLVFEHAFQNAALYRILLRGGSSKRIVDQIEGFPKNPVIALLGLTDMDALTLSMSRLATNGGDAGLAAEAIAVGLLSNTLLKLGLALVLGSTPFRRWVVPGLAGLGLAMGLGLWLAR